MDLAYAVVHGDPPEVYAAEDIEVLQWVIALEVVARTPASTLDPDTVQVLREALLEERWGQAVGLWMRMSRTVIDVYRMASGSGQLTFSRQTSPMYAFSSRRYSWSDASRPP
jgi:hypothetical protein